MTPLTHHRDPHTWAIAFSTAKANYGAHPNILVNNAGVLRNHNLADMSDEDWDVVFSTNFVSALKGGWVL
jgi:NAD(P)-dependent dehydrogenase (short-subunit alcohol dehydrogenase family)